MPGLSEGVGEALGRSVRVGSGVDEGRGKGISVASGLNEGNDEEVSVTSGVEEARDEGIVIASGVDEGNEEGAGVASSVGSMEVGRLHDASRQHNSAKRDFFFIYPKRSMNMQSSAQPRLHLL